MSVSEIPEGYRDVAELPLNQSVVVTNTEFMHIALTRTSEQEFTSVFRYPRNGTVVLEMVTNGGAHRINAIDKVFWNFTIDGVPATEMELGDLSQFSGFDVKSQERRITFLRGS